MSGKGTVLLDRKLPDPVILLIFGRGTQHVKKKQMCCLLVLGIRIRVLQPLFCFSFLF